METQGVGGIGHNHTSREFVDVRMSKGQQLTELRTSNAAGKHGKKSKDRANQRRKHLNQEKNDNG